MTSSARRQPSPVARLLRLTGADEDWVREAPPVGRRDWLVAGGYAVLGLLLLELTVSMGLLNDLAYPRSVQWLAVLALAVPLAWRRRAPLIVALWAAAHMFVVGVTMPEVMSQLTLQIAYFFSFFCAVAWARDRRTMLLVVGAILAFMAGWLVWQFALGSGYDSIIAEGRQHRTQGLFSPVAAALTLIAIVNLLYFAGATIAGQLSWWSAWQRDRLQTQADTIAQQVEALRQRAVIDERLRIARELHDAVGHHVSVIGVQAGAARHALAKRPEAAAEALGAIEQSSRDAVTQMRGLLGALRYDAVPGSSGDTAAPTEAGGRLAEPGASDIESLVAAASQPAATYTLVEDAEGAITRIPGAQGLTLHRVAQEALTNVRKHSTATKARVTVRVNETSEAPYAEVEVLDDGSPRHGSGGSGLGHLGVRERAAIHGGTVDIGPRATGGYRVRVRLPIPGVGR